MKRFNIKKRTAALILSGALVVGVAAPAAAYTYVYTSRHYGFWDGAYYMEYAGHKAVGYNPARTPAYDCYDYHLRKLGGLGSGTMVQSGWHAANTKNC